MKERSKEDLDLIKIKANNGCPEDKKDVEEILKELSKERESFYDMPLWLQKEVDKKLKEINNLK